MGSMGAFLQELDERTGRNRRAIDTLVEVGRLQSERIRALENQVKVLVQPDPPLEHGEQTDDMWSTAYGKTTATPSDPATYQFSEDYPEAGNYSKSLAVEVLEAMQQDCGPISAEPYSTWAKALAEENVALWARIDELSGRRTSTSPTSVVG